MHVDIAIIGAGPTGIGAGLRCQELNDRSGPESAISFQIIEANAAVGGLSSTETDAAGSHFDWGGHVIHSHYRQFDELLATVFTPEELRRLARHGFVRQDRRWIPTPYQHHLRLVDADRQVDCVMGLVDCHGKKPTVATFAEHIEATFGSGLAQHFFTPLNQKMWACPLNELSAGWVGQRSGSANRNVPEVDLLQVVRHLLLGEDEPDCDLGVAFPYPLKGGTGEIWTRAAHLLPSSRISLSTSVRAVHSQDRVVELANGESLHYGHLVSTIPLDLLLQAVVDRSELSVFAPRFQYTSTNLVGLTIAGSIPDEFSDKLWIYFPDERVPFHRATVLSNYSPHNAGQPGTWTILCEVNESAWRPIDRDTLVRDVIDALCADGLLPDRASVAGVWTRRLERGYPRPFVGRDALLDEVHGLLEPMNILSRGRFGGWRYEVSNQDHSFVQGMEAVDRIVLRVPETIYPSGRAVL